MKKKQIDYTQIQMKPVNEASDFIKAFRLGAFTIIMISLIFFLSQPVEFKAGCDMEMDGDLNITRTLDNETYFTTQFNYLQLDKVKFSNCEVSGKTPLFLAGVLQ